MNFKLDPSKKIITQSINSYNNVVRKIEWIIEHSEDDWTHIIHGEPIELEFDPSSLDFVPFESLTEEIINQWINDSIPENHKEYYLERAPKERKKWLEYRQPTDTKLETWLFKPNFEEEKSFPWQQNSV